MSDVTSEKFIERIFGVTNRSKLFVSPTRISIRFRKGITDEEAERVEQFLLQAAAQVSCDSTVRGHLACHQPTDTYYIVLQNEARDYSLRVNETR